MNSILDPSIVYDDTSSDVTEHDIDVVSDLWNMDGREVYRGSRDPRYTHANVYWLYDEDLSRVGLCEHSLENHAQFHILWLYDSEFATYFQEEGWTTGKDVWSVLSKNAYERCFYHGWTTPGHILEICLQSDTRFLTLPMVRNLPIVYSCSTCQRISLKPVCDKNHSQTLTIPKKEKVLFIDDDLVIHIPPTHSRVFTQLGLHDGDSSEQVQEQEPPHDELPPRDASPPHPAGPSE
jgi:hypothetical protein